MTSKELLAIGASVVAVGVMMWGSMILSTGIMMGLMTLAALVILYQRLPMLRRLTNRYPAGVDIAAGIFTYAILGSTIIGMIAAAVVGVGSSLLMNIQIERYQVGREESFIAALS